MDFLRPPLPEHIPVDAFKKGGPEFNKPIAQYLKKLHIFAQETEAWSAVIDALAQESTFHNLSAAALKNESEFPSHHGPGQGLVVTGFEDTYQPEIEVYDLNQNQPDLVETTLTQAWLFHLALYNHPEHLAALYQVAQVPFQAPRHQKSRVMELAAARGEALSIHDLTLHIGDAHQPRLSRTKLLTGGGLSVNYGRRQGLLKTHDSGRWQARNILVAGENPDVVGTPLMLASLAATHHLVGLPRDGFFKDIDRQVQLATETFTLLDKIGLLFGRTQAEQAKLIDWYQHNLIGVIESQPRAAIERATALYQAGIRTFRIYSPEPNNQLLQTVKALRNHAQQQDWEAIEIFAGQVVSVEQAQQLEQAGCDAIYIGVGGGGRCTTGLVANLAIDWPQLLWEMRGKIGIPVVVQGGGNDNAATTIALGGSGIGIVGKMAGTIESPGGTLYFFDPSSGKIFKYYGGEASDRMRAMAGRQDFLGRTINTEGGTSERGMLGSPDQGLYPTALQAITRILEALSAGLAFQNAKNIPQFRNRGPANIRRESPSMNFSRNTH